MNDSAPIFKNPFRPGAGHMPPYLAGRKEERLEFERLLGQDIILENMVLTGLRGVGKTVLLESFKPMAIASGWLWVGTDLSESASVSEENIAVRLMTDLSVITSNIIVKRDKIPQIGFNETMAVQDTYLNFATLVTIYQSTPGLVADKIKFILEFCWEYIKKTNKRGVIFAYDEAQNLADQAQKEQYPLSILLDVFQSVQKKGIPSMLALTGLPTLFTKLVEARTYAERMFHVVDLGSLNEEESREAILKPIEDEQCPIRLTPESITSIIMISQGYPYFIQFICREVYDTFLQKISTGEEPKIPIESIVRKLDADFFAGRWARATDRQRELMYVIASLETNGGEFTVQEIVNRSEEILDGPFSGSSASQMLASLIDRGLIYKNRYGKYLFAVPLLSDFIIRQRAMSV
jgi:hypothetical protein